LCDAPGPAARLAGSAERVLWRVDPSASAKVVWGMAQTVRRSGIKRAGVEAGALPILRGVGRQRAQLTAHLRI
jgi:hypothetical protein